MQSSLVSILQLTVSTHQHTLHLSVSSLASDKGCNGRPLGPAGKTVVNYLDNSSDTRIATSLPFVSLRGIPAPTCNLAQGVERAGAGPAGKLFAL